MTDEKVTPHGDELSDDELDGVAGGSDAIQSVKSISGERIESGVEAVKPAGELAIYDDQTAFTGNGLVTPGNVLQRGLEQSSGD